MVPLRQLPIVVPQAPHSQSRSRVIWMGHCAACRVLPDGKVVNRKNFRQPGMSSELYFGYQEVFEILVIMPNKDLVIGPFEVLLRLF